RIIFIELPKFNPQDADAADLLTAWLSFLKNPVFMDDAFLEIKEVKAAMEALKYISADDEVRAIADLRQKTINDYNSEMTVAREEGLEEGIAIGKEEGIAIGEAKGIAIGEAKGKEEGIAIGEAKGKEEGLREAARSMLAAGIPPETVSHCTKLSIEEIAAMKK
ncbi:MAG: PD-(D/E)XK nuclease family transposase, partial [Holosporales bacterium]|nr:PD-(D/E)XK nuclease family transposase [Holosporales bacterium]